MKPGPTLSDLKGERRIRKLEESRFNCRLKILEMQDRIDCMTHEIAQIKKERNETRTADHGM